MTATEALYILKDMSDKIIESFEANSESCKNISDDKKYTSYCAAMESSILTLIASEKINRKKAWKNKMKKNHRIYDCRNKYKSRYKING